jgi:4-hydroxybenzoate polyprenyltransferase
MKKGLGGRTGMLHEAYDVAAPRLRKLGDSLVGREPLGDLRDHGCEAFGGSSADTPRKLLQMVKNLIVLMRPVQWIKNGFVFMPLIFSAKLAVFEDVTRVMGLFLAFCLASSAVYILNDFADREQDRVHPLKKNRPLARGDVAPAEALLFMGLVAVGAFAVTMWIGSPPVCVFLIGGYILLNVLYSFKLKNVVIVDVLAISTGFMMRVLAGAAVIAVSVSSWLLLCTFSLSLFLALGKRRHEVVALSGDAGNHRPVLDHYSVQLLDQLLQSATTSTFIFYCLYSVRGNPAHGLEAEKMMYTIPIVAYGIFRYMYLIYHKEDGGSPTALLLTDPPLLGCNIVWLAACIVIIYS